MCVRACAFVLLFLFHSFLFLPNKFPSKVIGRSILKIWAQDQYPCRESSSLFCIATNASRSWYGIRTLNSVLFPMVLPGPCSGEHFLWIDLQSTWTTSTNDVLYSTRVCTQLLCRTVFQMGSLEGWLGIRYSRHAYILTLSTFRHYSVHHHACTHACIDKRSQDGYGIQAWGKVSGCTENGQYTRD